MPLVADMRNVPFQRLPNVRAVLPDGSDDAVFDILAISEAFFAAG
jgi:hypothetical protein